MRIESLMVRVLRQGEQYTNDQTELRVAIEEGDDWEEIERRLRIRAVALIKEHWEEYCKTRDGCGEKQPDDIPF